MMKNILLENLVIGLFLNWFLGGMGLIVEFQNVSNNFPRAHANKSLIHFCRSKHILYSKYHCSCKLNVICQPCR